MLVEGMQSDDGDGTGPAPLPPHERSWRHPSEIGAHAWATTEPPLVLGRGLAAVTASVALVLSGVLAFTMLSTHPGRPTFATATSVPSGGFAQASAPEPAPGTDVAAPPSDPTDVTPPRVEPTAAPVPTYRVRSAIDDAGITDVSAVEPVYPVAIAVGDGALIITTLAAVDDRREVELVDASGTATTARVLFTDETSGLAVLLPETTAPIDGLAVADAIEVGDTLEVPGRTSAPVEVTHEDLAPGASVTEPEAIEAAIGELLSASEPPLEGEPVLNQRGELVAICTRGADGPMLVLVDRIASLRRAIGALLRPTVWLGLLVEDTPSGGIVIAALDPDGPARQSGLLVGDMIVAIDGTDIRSTIELAGALAVRHVGDVVQISVVHADGASAVISVELAAPPPRL